MPARHLPTGCRAARASPDNDRPREQEGPASPMVSDTLAYPSRRSVPPPQVAAAGLPGAHRRHARPEGHKGLPGSNAFLLSNAGQGRMPGVNPSHAQCPVPFQCDNGGSTATKLMCLWPGILVIPKQIVACLAARAPSSRRPLRPARQAITADNGRSGCQRWGPVMPSAAYRALAASRRAADPASRNGQILNQMTEVRAPVSPVSAASATSSAAAAR